MLIYAARLVTKWAELYVLAEWTRQHSVDVAKNPVMYVMPVVPGMNSLVLNSKPQLSSE